MLLGKDYLFNLIEVGSFCKIKKSGSTGFFCYTLLVKVEYNKNYLVLCRPGRFFLAETLQKDWT